MNQAFLTSAARPLLVLHAVLGFAAVATATHLAVYAVLGARRPAVFGRRLAMFGLLNAVVALAQGTLGALLYPAFRLQVRLAYLDAAAPDAVRLFEFKEHAAALAMVMALVLAVVVRTGPQRLPRVALPALTIAVALITWSVALAGTWVTAIKAIGGGP